MMRCVLKSKHNPTRLKILCEKSFVKNYGMWAKKYNKALKSVPACGLHRTLLRNAA